MSFNQEMNDYNNCKWFASLRNDRKPHQCCHFDEGEICLFKEISPRTLVEMTRRKNCHWQGVPKLQGTEANYWSKEVR